MSAEDYKEDITQEQAPLQPERSVQETKEPAVENPWLDAWTDPVAGVKAYSGSIQVSDVFGDGDSKLIVGNIDCRLKVFRNTNLQSELELLGVPVAVCSFYQDDNAPHIPAIAVASGSSVFIYKSLKPYFKFTIPPIDLDIRETAVWANLANDNTNIEEAFKQLTSIKENGVQLSSRSIEFLSQENPQEFVERVKNIKLEQHTVITCMTTLYKSIQEEQSISSLVIGTESKAVWILDQWASNILEQIKIPGVPTFFSISGCYDVEYRIAVACRDGVIYTIKNGKLLGTVFETGSPPIGICLIPTKYYTIIGCMDNTLHCYHNKGKKAYTIYFNDDLLCLSEMNVQSTYLTTCIIIGLRNGEIRLYNEKTLIYTFKINGVPTAIIFGRYGRAPHSLIIADKSGTLTVKMLRRKTNLLSSSQQPGPPPEQDIPLRVPKKTKLYVDQTQRERERAIEMHRIFQGDLCRIRLDAARAYVKIISEGSAPVSYNSQNSVRLNATVQGLGPHFRIHITIQNTGKVLLRDVPVSFVYNHYIYRLQQSLLVIPVLVSGVAYDLETDIYCIDPNGCADEVKVFVVDEKSTIPLITAIVNMPISEVDLQQ